MVSSQVRDISPVRVFFFFPANYCEGVYACVCVCVRVCVSLCVCGCECECARVDMWMRVRRAHRIFHCTILGVHLLYLKYKVRQFWKETRTKTWTPRSNTNELNNRPSKVLIISSVKGNNLNTRIFEMSSISNTLKLTTPRLPFGVGVSKVQNASDLDAMWLLYSFPSPVNV